MALHGEASSFNINAVAEIIINLWAIHSYYSTDQIYKVHKTGLFFKLRPRRTCIVQSKDKSSIREIKKISAKNLVSGYVSTNVD